MSEEARSTGSSPSKSTSWVKFDEGESRGRGVPEAHDSAAAKTTPSHSSSSGVSSVRGSVNSLSSARQLQLDHERQSGQSHVITTQPEGASLDISEIQVVDEQSLRRKASLAPGSSQHKSQASVSNNGHEPPPRVERLSSQSSSMDNVNLNDEQLASAGLRQVPRGKQFENGEVIVTLLPVNERFPWVSPAKFRPELVPEELMAPILTLTVEEYVNTLEKLTTDMRFILYNIMYKRILVIWIATAFIILLALLFSGYQGVELFACGVLWLIMNASAIFVCMWIKLKLNKKLEKCMSSVNAGLQKHKIILGVDDRGKLSCHKVNLCFIYFESSDCIKRLEAILSEKPEDGPPSAQTNGGFDREAYLKDVEQFEDVEVVVAGRNSVKLDRKHERAEKLYLHYIQRWAKDYLRRRLDWMVEDLYGNAEYAANTNPRHLKSALCPCQYIEEHLRNKRVRESLNPCIVTANPCHWCD
ncbi:hypothetical protein TCAL_03883 [Tigriopus californicus]|uniref:Transmembrane protein 268 n=2 Tax=Tigriopus californicus TaxID=6832 RepID=A0A553NBZ8_TIGCA|nr:uncharacterized protein LOC131887549 isoform X2 [Tigriopus californicus]XP_059092144.1 uncharacterized protein LOC131887549 isoform X2 [Tigriopus californicus]XP_059092145.1 uncharacterized protein LOC131887549 isoform X2 [Tigriopus californicus]TRY62889.1 hypothetical protein TCAL_03883 [Tigriopus californicus]